MRRTGISIGVVASAFLFGGGAASAGKGGGVDTGVVYAAANVTGGSQIYAMNPDGSGKTALPVFVYGGADASRALHGGHRWFLTMTHAAGETTATGGAKYDVSAFRDDGASVRLTTTSSDVNVSRPLWGPGDTSIAWSVNRWNGLRWAPEGIYAASVIYSAGDVIGLDAMPASPIVSATSWSLGGYDWSPDGTRFVVSDTDASGWGTLRVYTVASTTSSALPTATSAGDPRWSPDGATVAYQALAGPSSIRRVAVVGFADTQVLAYTNGPTKSVAYDSPRWSPNGTNLAVAVHSRKYPDYFDDIGRCSATGGTVTTLTSDINTGWSMVAWR